MDRSGLDAALENGFIPVVAPTATNIRATGSEDAILNINADTSAGHIARELRAHQIVVQTDVAGVLDATKRLIPRMTKSQGGDLIASGIAAGGMIPKIEGCIEALTTANSGHIIDGRIAGALIACVAGPDVGTRIV